VHRPSRSCRRSSPRSVAAWEREHDLKVYKDTLAALGTREPRHEEPVRQATQPLPQNDQDYARSWRRSLAIPWIRSLLRALDPRVPDAMPSP